MSEFLDAALDYAARGWPVFPLRPRNKTPAIPSCHPKGDPLRGVCHGACGKEGHGLHDATCDIATVERWWNQSPQANVGLRTGVAFDVLDVDGSLGQEVLIGVMPDGVMPLGYGPWSVTPGKNDENGVHLGSGDHLLYLPTGLNNKAGFLPHLDWRGNGGYVVAPPSIHPDGHGVYEWTYGPGGLIEVAPQWLVDLVVPPREATTAGAITTQRRGQAGTAYGQRALESEIGRLAMLRGTSGTRNEQLNASAYTLAQLVAGGVLKAEDVIEALSRTALGIGLDELEAEQTIESGMRAGLSKPRRAPA